MENTFNRDLAIRYLNHMQAGDVAAALHLASDDATFWMPGTGCLGKSELSAFFGQVGPMIESMIFTIHGITDQNGRVAVEASGEAQLRNGQTYRNEYHFLFLIKDGKINLFKEYADTAPAAVFAL